MENKEKIIEVINNFNNKKILVIGDLILDHYSFCKINRVNPEQPASPLLNVEDEKSVLGGAGNVANNLRSLGAQVSLIGLIGNDIYGEAIQNICQDKEIKLHRIMDGRKTSVKNRFIAHGQQITRVDKEESHNIPENLIEEIFHIVENEIQNYDAILYADYNKGLLSEVLVQKINNLAIEKNKKIYAAMKPMNANFFKNSTLVCCNSTEAEYCTGILPKDKESMIEVGKNLMNLLNSKHLIITLGEKGIFSYDKLGKYELISTKAKSIIDVTGAGDTVISLIALSNLDLNMHDSTELANLAAGIVIEKIGTATLSKNELIEAINNLK